MPQALRIVLEEGLRRIAADKPDVVFTRCEPTGYEWFGGVR